MVKDDDDDRKGEPLYRAVARRIGRMIEQGSFAGGDRLPSIRALARQLRVGVNTVAQAYALLENLQVVEARPQSGYYVRPRLSRKPSDGRGPQLTPRLITHGPEHRRAAGALSEQAGLMALGHSGTAPDLLPAAKLGRMLAARGRNHPLDCAAYTASAGVEYLRVQIAKRSLGWGCGWSPEQVIITSGCMEAVRLALHATCRAGDTIAVESPVYYNFLHILQWMQLKVLEIPAAPGEGMNLEVLDYALRQGAVHACLVIANFSNPLGGVMSDTKKRDLVQLLARHEVPLIEDDVYGDLGFSERRPVACQAFDRQGLVLYCSSFAKTLAPGYRVGWIEAGRYQEKVRELKTLLNLSTATPTQLAIAEFLANGGYDRHLRAARRILRERMEQMRKGVLHCFPAGTRVTRPDGGFFLWLEMPEQVDGWRLCEEAMREGIMVVPGALFGTGDRYQNCIRLNGSGWSPSIGRAVEKLGRLADALMRAGNDGGAAEAETVRP